MTKRIAPFLLTAVFLATFITPVVLLPLPTTGSEVLQAAPLPTDGVVIYQFHRRYRCEACVNLEKAINEALKIHFPEELNSGQVVYRVMDLDAEGIDNYEKKYDFFYNTVIVVDVEEGVETRFKNLESVWELVDDKEAVMEFIRSHVEEYL